MVYVVISVLGLIFFMYTFVSNYILALACFKYIVTCTFRGPCVIAHAVRSGFVRTRKVNLFISEQIIPFPFITKY